MALKQHEKDGRKVKDANTEMDPTQVVVANV
jgi:hypothetical protein